MIKTIRIAGFGGQGVMLLGQILAYCATLKNYHTVWVPTYGPETRGGTANCMVTIADETIYSPVFTMCDDLIVLNAPSYQKFKETLKEHGQLFFNASLIEKVESNHAHVFGVPLNELAVSLNNPKVINLIMLGRYLKQIGLFEESDVKAALHHFFGEEKSHLIDINIEALRLGKTI
ncbi:MAG: 2-oxoacid:ferredoxin oxidoreductase subunit gamma [Methanomicrobia archaeon]|nr:2-oxoacid:ferredoxin oxidoreductase subunit gamma [Methanomicrobia archaeon]